MELLTGIIAAIASCIAAFMASSLALKNSKQEKYFTEKKNIYYALASILPDVDEFMAQSDYLDGSEGHCGAEDRLKLLQSRLEQLESDRQKEESRSVTDRKYLEEIRIDINNTRYKLGKHEEYLSQMKALRDKIDTFEKEGQKNLLRIFADEKVWSSYEKFKVALDNEYLTNIGVKKEDITFHINALIFYMRKDLSGKK